MTPNFKYVLVALSLAGTLVAGVMLNFNGVAIGIVITTLLAVWAAVECSCSEYNPEVRS